MNFATDRISLDVHKTVAQATLYWKLGDTARRIEAVLTENGKPFDLTGCTVAFTAPTEPKPIFHYCDFKDGRIVYEALPGTDKSPGVTDDVGQLSCEFRVFGNNGSALTSPRFTINVMDTVVDPSVLEESEKGNIGLLEAIIVEAEKATEETLAVKDDIETKLAKGEFNGAPGSVWHNTTINIVGNPYSAIAGAKMGDYCLNTSNSDVYKAGISSAGTQVWIKVGNIGGKDAELTAADKAEIAQMVLDSLPVYDGEVVAV